MNALEFLAEWAARSAVLILAGALVLLVLRVKDSSVRLAVWVALLCWIFDYACDSVDDDDCFAAARAGDCVAGSGASCCGAHCGFRKCAGCPAPGA